MSESMDPMSDRNPHPSERMTRRNGVRRYLLAHTLDDQIECKKAALAINKFYVESGAARKSAYDGLKRLKGMKEAEAFLEEKYDRNDQLLKEMKRHERDNKRDQETLAKLSKTLHRQLGADAGDLPPSWSNDGPAEIEFEVMSDVYATLTDPKWHRYHNEAMDLKEKMTKSLSAENTVSVGL